VYKFHHSSERKPSPFCVTLPNPLNEHPWLRVSVRGNAGYESYCPHTLPHLVYSGKRKLHIRILPNFEQSNISVRYTTVSNHTNNATIDHRLPAIKTLSWSITSSYNVSHIISYNVTLGAATPIYSSSTKAIPTSMPSLHSAPSPTSQ
jgi:hypothetical protein